MRVVLSGHSDVEFVGYSIPHPSESTMNLRLQTLTKDTNEVLSEGFKTLNAISKTIREKFLEAAKTKKKWKIVFYFLFIKNRSYYYINTFSYEAHFLTIFIISSKK